MGSREGLQGGQQGGALEEGQQGGAAIYGVVWGVLDVWMVALPW